ncbi:4'-phosphopantetheinyl transferase family protein [Demequina aurantiaca]|uniref:4'-phosphopantetheinyl transferase family protein n=1 Tax=Demequina aurantiaca TaxID=676200 RepID=UPI003D357BA2
MQAPAIVVRWARIPPADTNPQTARLRRAESNNLALAAAGALLRSELPQLAVTRRCEACGSRAHGRPGLTTSTAVSGGTAVPSLTVSIARGRDAAIAAVAIADDSHEIGVDLESSSQPLSPGFADVVLGAGERALHPMTSDSLLRTWVRKEAVLKAAGTGLRLDPRRVTLEGLNVTGGPAGPWSLVDLDLAPDLVAAVAVRCKADLDLGLDVRMKPAAMDY